jgi:hypothetical protein
LPVTAKVKERCLRGYVPLIVILALLALSSPALASPISRHDRDVIRFFQHHPRQAATPAGSAALLKASGHLLAAVRSLQSTAASTPLALAGHWKGPPWPVPPAWFRRDAACIEMGESTDGAGSANLYGMLDGWAAAGGQGWAGAASPSEQLYRVWVLWNMDGWGPWTTAAGCGLG